MKIYCLDNDVTPVGSPDRAEHAILDVGGDFCSALFRPIHAAFVGREPLCDVGAPS